MDDMTSYYPPPPPPSALHNPPPYPYYAPPPPPLPPAPPQPPLGAAAPPPSFHHSHFPQPYNHQYHSYDQHHSPFSSYPSQTPHPQTPQDDVRTLFIAGLPEDVTAREVYNLFREFPGYQSSQLRTATHNSQAFGFAVFSDQPSAVAAMQALNGLVFDLEKQSTLYIDFAKSNSRSKRLRTDDGRSGSSDKKVKGSVTFSRGPSDSGVGSNSHVPGMGNSTYSMTGYPSTQSHGFDSGAVIGSDTNRMGSIGPYVPQNNIPCPTLFVANLGQTCSEQELNQIFSRCPGFLKLKMQNKNGAPVAFVDFQDVSSSTAALNNLQETILYSSNGEGMRLEFAKSRMGMRKKPS